MRIVAHWVLFAYLLIRRIAVTWHRGNMTLALDQVLYLTEYGQWNPNVLISSFCLLLTYTYSPGYKCSCKLFPPPFPTLSLQLEKNRSEWGSQNTFHSFRTRQDVWIGLICYWCCWLPTVWIGVHNFWKQSNDQPTNPQLLINTLQFYIRLFWPILEYPPACWQILSYSDNKAVEFCNTSTLTFCHFLSFYTFFLEMIYIQAMQNPISSTSGWMTHILNSSEIPQCRIYIVFIGYDDSIVKMEIY